jgi:hypothetical protein
MSEEEKDSATTYGANIPMKFAGHEAKDALSSTVGDLNDP